MPKKGSLEAAIDAAAGPPAPVTPLTPHQMAWACFEAALSAALDQVEAYEATFDKIHQEAQLAEERLRSATIYRGPALLADLLPEICDNLMEITGKVWHFVHQPTKPMSTIYQEGGPTLCVVIDDMIRPKFVRVQTYWSHRGTMGWGETCFAECMINSGAKDPTGKIALTRGTRKIAELIARDVMPAAEALWPTISAIIEDAEKAKERQVALAAEIAEALGDPHVITTPEGHIRSRFTATAAPFVSWALDIDRHRAATFSGSARDVDVNHPLIAALVALQAPAEPLALAPREPLALAAE